MLWMPPAAAPAPVSFTFTAFELSRSSRPYLDRLALPFYCFSQASPIPLRSGVHTEKVRRSAARTPEAPQSTYPTTTKHRDLTEHTSHSPDSLTTTYHRHRLLRPLACSGCSRPDGPLPPSLPLKVGSLAQLAREVGQGRKSGSLGRPGADRASRTVLRRSGPRGGSGVAHSTHSAGDHGSVW